MRNAIFSNPKTTIFGVAVILCEAVGKLWPELEPACNELVKLAVGFGLIAAGDAKPPSQ